MVDNEGDGNVNQGIGRNLNSSEHVQLDDYSRFDANYEYRIRQINCLWAVSVI